MNKQIKKTLLIILSVCASVFALYCVVWAVYVSTVYSPFIKALNGADTIEYTGACHNEQNVNRKRISFIPNSQENIEERKVIF